MLLDNKIAVVYGAGGAIGGAVARAFAREGAAVFLAGRTRGKLEAVAEDIRSAGGTADVATLDALDPAAVTRHADAVAAKAGRIDVAMNALGFVHVQGKMFADLSMDEYIRPIDDYARAQFSVARAVAPHMMAQRRGVIINLSTPGSFLLVDGTLGYGIACAVKETFSRKLAGELGPHGIRTICIRPHAIPQAAAAGSHANQVFAPAAEAAGLSIAEMLAGAAESTPLKRLPTLAQVADTAAFAASDSAGAMTGAILDLSSGTIVN